MPRSARLSTEPFFPRSTLALPGEPKPVARADPNGSWSIVLAGGRGVRMQPWIEGWLGERRPKQYCRFVGRRSMIEHAWIRARQISGVDRLVTVVAPDHEPYLSELGYPIPGALITQPEMRGTAAGLFLPLTAVMVRRRDAIVHVLPSDHFIHSNARFVEHLRQAESVLGEYPDRIVLAAAEADRAEPDFGWIAPGASVATSTAADVRTVERFHEKPDLSGARRYLDAGYLWNTMILSARASTLWQLASSHVPEALWPFEQLRSMVRRGEHSRAEMRAGLERAYDTLPERDLSRDLLEEACDHSLVMPLRGIEWSDWGRPERLQESIDRHRLTSNLPRVPTPHVAADWASDRPDLGTSLLRPA